MNLFHRIKDGLGIFCHYYVKPDPAKLGYFGKNAALGIPADLKKPQNVYLYDFARLGRRSTIMTMGDSKFVMKRGCLTAEGLVVVTSNHHQKIGQFLSGENEDNLYRDIIVEEDVWIGINVILLSGAHIRSWCHYRSRSSSQKPDSSLFGGGRQPGAGHKVQVVH